MKKSVRSSNTQQAPPPESQRRQTSSPQPITSPAKTLDLTKFGLTLPDMDVFNAFALGTSGYLALQSLPLLLAPSAIVSLLASEPRRITAVETYLSRTLALTLLAFAALNLLLTLDSRLQEETPGEGTTKDPYAYPALIVATIFHAATAFYIYMNITSSGLGFALGAGVVFSTGLFALGLWTILFGTEKGRISKSTGADKRTANFPFKNTESAKEKKKESRSKKSVLRMR